MTSEAKRRKETPVFSGVLRYFTDAIKEVARVSFIGNEQHNPGTPLHWDRSKSKDEADALTRHLLDAGTFDTDGVRHTAKVAWRALALLQKELEQTKKVYISGAITAKDKKQQKKNLQRFFKKELELAGEGREVFNPAKLEQKGWTWEMYLSRDLKWIMDNRPKMYMMVGWEDSKGARLEHALALDLGLEIEYEVT